MNDINEETKLLSDKEVGNCWRCSPLLPPPGEDAVKQVIRKLVEERAVILAIKAMQTISIAQADVDACLPDAWRQFGIDPKEYPL